jgi:hypothetical protein
MERVTIYGKFLAPANQRGCPCGSKLWDHTNWPTVSLVMQLAKLGKGARTRARSITVHCCDRCIMQIHTKQGRKLRMAIAAGLRAQLVDLRNQGVEKNAA